MKLLALSYCQLLAQDTFTPRPMPPITVDGQAKEWDDAELLYEPKGIYNINLAYSTSSQGPILTVYFKSSDPATQMRIMRNGLLLQIDTTGKRKRTVSLQFPLAATEEDMPMRRQAPASEGSDEDARTGGMPGGPIPGGGDMRSMRLRMAVGWKDMQVAGFYPPVTGKLPLQNTYGIAARIAWDANDALVYEAAIPLKLCVSAARLAGAKPLVLGVGLKLAGIKMAAFGADRAAGGALPADQGTPMMGGPAGTGMGGMGGGMPGMAGGMAPGGRGGMAGPPPGFGAGNNNPFQDFSKTYEKWYRVVINPQ